MANGEIAGESKTSEPILVETAGDLGHVMLAGAYDGAEEVTTMSAQEATMGSFGVTKDKSLGGLYR